MRLLLLGPPGAGKGTQAKRMSRRYGLTALSSGDILRGQIQIGSAVGKRAAPFVSSGALVPDDVITDVMLAGIAGTPYRTGFILDGFPRTLPQAQALDEGIEDLGVDITAVLNFDMDDRDIVSRIVGRRSCGKCGAVYNVDFLPPKTADVCDVCGSPLVQRVDDREDVVVNRLKTYRAQTAPLVKYYSDKGLLHTIDASAAADAVEAQVGLMIDSLSAGK